MVWNYQYIQIFTGLFRIFIEATTVYCLPRPKFILGLVPLFYGIATFVGYLIP